MPRFRLLFLALIVLLSTCCVTQDKSNESVINQGDIEATRTPNRSGSGHADNSNWRELYNIPYTVACMDERLGVSVVREFQQNVRAPSSIELAAIQTCAIERADLLPEDDPRRGSSENAKEGDSDRDRDEDEDESVRDRIEKLKEVSGGWIKTGDPKMDQFVLGYIPTAEEWRCGVGVVGADILRDIRAGNHSITQEESNNLKPCFRLEDPSSLVHPLAEFDCIPLDILLEFVDYYRPSWEQLECHLTGLERYSLPKQIRSSGVGAPFGIRNSNSPLFPPLWDRVMNDPYFSDFNLNFSPSSAKWSLPPRYDEEYNSLKCPEASRDSSGQYVLDKYWLSEEIRGAAIGFIIEKQKGRSIYADLDMCSNAYIVQGDLEDYRITLGSVQEFRDFATNIAIPAYAMKAKGAEKVRAEILQLNSPMNNEIEVPFSQYEFLYNLPPSEQVALAQWYLDAIIGEVRKHFNGMVWIASAGQYDSGHPGFPASGRNPSYGPHWKDLSFAAADHVSFTFDLVCSFDHAKRFLSIQFEGYMEIVQRDDVTYHIIFSFDEDKFGPTLVSGCVDEYEEKKIEMHTWLLSKLNELPIDPLFLYGIPTHPRDWTRDEEGTYPTSDDARSEFPGAWKLFNLDEAEPDPDIQPLYTAYALSHILN